MGNKQLDSWRILEIALVGGNRGLQHYQYLRALLCAILFESQQFLRVDAKIDHSAASLRDIARATHADSVCDSNSTTPGTVSFYSGSRE